ncbi:MAG: hypothetical protein K2K57_11805 [Oscillospiraceae bacterium]|nr:hypothetical protein [Oscillospiraceae bacterium]
MNVNGIGERKTANAGRNKIKGDKQGFAGELSNALCKSAVSEAKNYRAAERDTLEIGSKNSADVFGSACAADTSEMSDFEYEAYIYRTIDKMYKNNDGRQNNWIIFSDEGLAAMKADPAYEKWVLREIYGAINSATPFMGRDVKVQRDIIIRESPEACIFETHVSGDGIDDGFSGPTNEEYRRIVETRKKEYEKHRKYAKLLRENAIEKADMELEHIRGIYKDMLHTRKSLCAVLDDMDCFWTVKGE